MRIKLRKRRGLWFTQFNNGLWWFHNDLKTAIAFLKSQGAPA